MQGSYLTTTANVSTESGLQTAVRDAYLRNSNNGVKFLFDLAFPWCYPSGALSGRPAAGNPANNAVIADVSENSNGIFVKDTSTVTYAGGGFDFSAVSGSGLTFIQAPNTTLATIQAQQYFMIMIYMKIPTLANINSQGTIQPFFATSRGYQIDPDLGLLCLNGNSSNSIGFRRETAIGSQAGITVSCVNHNGQMAQVAVWRNATEMGMRIKSVAGGSTVATVASGSNNTADFSNLPPMFGSVVQYNGNTFGRFYRIYRGAIENLALSGRTPITVLDEDWTRIQARITASAAANGGTSIIFI